MEMTTIAMKKLRLSYRYQDLNRDEDSEKKMNQIIVEEI